MDVRFSLELPPFAPKLIGRIFDLSSLVFGHADVDRIRWRLSSMPEASIFVAESCEGLVGFKAGYAMSEAKYYSWLGGVHPDYRRRGVASDLMKRQHHWLTERGYSIVETAANQQNHAMAQLNLQHGFSVCGVRVNPDNTQVLFLKVLKQNDQQPSGRA